MKRRVSSERIIIVSYFVGIILAGSLLLMLPVSWTGPEPLRYVDALFTSTSAVCVTGLTSVDTALYSRFGQWVIMLLIQFGGLGIITFAAIYIANPRRRVSLVSRTIIKEYYIDEVQSNPKRIVKGVLITTFAIEAIGAVILWTQFRGRVGDDPFVAIFHAVSAFCNAGFSTFSENLEGYVANPAVNLAICGLVITGGLGFLVHEDLVARALGKARRLSYHSKVAIGMTAILLILGTVAFLILEWDGAYAAFPWPMKILAAFFQSMAPRTAGFDTVSQVNLGYTSIILTMILMFIGACPGSTGGGVKTTTFFVLFMVALKGADEDDALCFRGRAIPARAIIKALGIVGKAVFIVVASVVLLTWSERAVMARGEIRFVQYLFEAISAFGTVGLSMNTTFTLNDLSKIIVVLTMFAGRIGLFTMALPIPGKEIERYVDLPKADVMLG